MHLQEVEIHPHLFLKALMHRGVSRLCGGRFVSHGPLQIGSAGLARASRRWRKKHRLKQCISGSTGCIGVFHLVGRNCRRFHGTSSSAEKVSCLVLDHIRTCIISVDLPPSLHAWNLCKIWHIAWPSPFLSLYL
ncbi:hypothetical protein Salat_1175100 [Sesamum alatum]|uniref:Uncharacterized protein n=1 Tax=Sesamum alatum TaxID=300844 RepID=A0AAE1YEV1_9LAMI|nr:hypothetical protein Salat_1175100 [Sesamum alatum]